MKLLIIDTKDLGTAFNDVNKKLIFNPELFTTKHPNPTVRNLIVKTQSSNCDLDLGRLGYSMGKWKHLLRCYLDMELLKDFKGLVYKKLTTLSLTYMFKKKIAPRGGGNCLISLTVVNMNKFKDVSVIVEWRKTEVDRKWAADLLLIHKIIEYLELKPQEVLLHLHIGVQVINYIIPQVYYLWDIDINKLDPKIRYHQRILDRYELYFKPGAKKCTTYARNTLTQELMEDLRKGNKLPKITSKTVKLEV